MKYRLQLLLCLLSISFTHAQDLENSLLWKISGNGLEQSSYLFGTIHITCDATLEDKVKKALDETTHLVLELDADDPSLQTKMLAGMYMKDGKTLKDYTTEKEYAKIDSLFKERMGFSVEMINNVKPILISAMFYPNFLNCDTPQSYEEELMKVAKSQNEEVEGLETVEEQLKIFDDIPYEEQVKDLIRSANNDLEYDKKLFEKMYEIYEAEDIDAMLDMMNDDNYAAISNHQDEFLSSRNKKWIPKIGEFAKKEPTFFGVGAGHLAGKEGVIQLLRKAGYTVEAVE